MIKFTAALALAAIAFADMPAPASAHQHGAAQSQPLQLAQRAPASCLKDREACIAAGTQTGQHGQRYVPPDVVRQCYSAYRICTGQR